jgi:hypothetical protein
MSSFASTAPPLAPMITSPLADLDVLQVSDAARRETRNREVHLPPISVYRWWARRTEAVFGAIVDAVAADRAGERLLIADPFAGGGTIPLAAVIRRQRVYAQDLNPWAAHGLAAMLGLPSSEKLKAAASRLEELAAHDLKRAYGTTTPDGAPATIVHTFRVATARCSSCEAEQRLYPHALVSLLKRKERCRPDAFLACAAGHLFKGNSSLESIPCPTCKRRVDPKAAYTVKRRVRCWSCGAEASLDTLLADEIAWTVVLVERLSENGRAIDFPTAQDVAIAESSEWKPARDLEPIPAGQETHVLLRHGYRSWHDIYPPRQRAIFERLLDLAPEAADGDTQLLRAIRYAIVGAAEMAGYLSRWDRYYLKSYEAMAGHRFNFTTFAAEPNVWGAGPHGRGTVSRRLAHFAKASEWLAERAGHVLAVEEPHQASENAERLSDDQFDADVHVVQGSSERILLPDASVDLVLTDPPYHDDVQYGELSLPLRAWADLPLEASEREAVVNGATGQNAGHDAYRALLELIFTEARRVLRADGHFVFSYANRRPDAWVAVLSALRSSGFRACGYAIVHSENETDYAKRGVRACTLDLILDLVPEGETELAVFRPAGMSATQEEAFLRIVGETFLQLSLLEDGWERALAERLRSSSFLADARTGEAPRAARQARR